MKNRSLFDAFFMHDLSVYGSLIFFSLLLPADEGVDLGDDENVD